jgi:hypothetical protein
MIAARLPLSHFLPASVKKARALFGTEMRMLFKVAVKIPDVMKNYSGQRDLDICSFLFKNSPCPDEIPGNMLPVMASQTRTVVHSSRCFNQMRQAIMPAGICKSLTLQPLAAFCRACQNHGRSSV